MAKRVYGFESEEAFRRVAEATKQVERNRVAPHSHRMTGGYGVVFQTIIGKTDASHAKSASGTISVWAGTAAASLSDTTDNITAYNRFADLDSGKWVACTMFPWGWEITCGECP